MSCFGVSSFLFFFRNWKPWFIALSVGATTSFPECLKLSHNSLLEKMRSCFLGKTILGTTFMWSDFPYYVMGSVLGLMCITYLKNSVNKQKIING